MFATGGKISFTFSTIRNFIDLLDEGIVTVFDVRRRAAIHRFIDDGSYSTTSMCVSPNQQYFITG